MKDDGPRLATAPINKTAATMICATHTAATVAPFFFIRTPSWPFAAIDRVATHAIYRPVFLGEGVGGALEALRRKGGRGPQTHPAASPPFLHAALPALGPAVVAACACRPLECVVKWCRPSGQLCLGSCGRVGAVVGRCGPFGRCRRRGEGRNARNAHTHQRHRWHTDARALIGWIGSLTHTSVFPPPLHTCHR